MTKKQLKKFISYIVSITVVFFFVTTIDIYFPSFVNSIDNKIKDYMFILRGPQKNSNSVVIIDIDEESLSKLGQWPWPRDKIAKILENLALANVGAIGLDIVFAETDQSSPSKVLKELNIKVNNVPNFDEELNYVVQNTPTILGYQFQLTPTKFIKRESIDIPAIIVEKNKADGKEYLIEAKGTILNHPSLQESGYSSGFFNNIPDSSGVIRSVPLIIKYDDQLYPSLALEIVRASMNIDTVYVNYSTLGVENIQIGNFIIPTDRNGRFIVNFIGKKNSFKYYSASDIYANNFNKDEFEGKIVIIGTTASGLNDLRATPLDSVYPGVEVHANIIENIITKDFLRIPTWVDSANLTIVLIIIVFTTILIRFLPLWLNPIIFFVVIFAILAFTYYIFITYGIILNSFLAIIATILAILNATFLQYVFEVKKEKSIKEKFASKVSKDVMENLLNDEENKIQTIQKEITVFFSNIRNFTYISEYMQNPTDLTQFLNEYLDPMVDIIIEQKGTVDKFMGDSIMAYWNAPSTIPNHADAALKCALLQLYKLKELNRILVNGSRYPEVIDMCEEKRILPLNIGVGINTGVATVGEMGSKHRSDYSIIGDSVNLGFRLESLCKYYGSKCNISNFTKWQLEDNYIFRFLDLVTIKGQSQPLQVWEVIDFDSSDDTNKLFDIPRQKLDEELFTYHRALDLYQNGNFQEALDIFEELEKFIEKSNNKIYKIYIDRCNYFIQNPPKNFDGVFKHED